MAAGGSRLLGKQMPGQTSDVPLVHGSSYRNYERLSILFIDSTQEDACMTLMRAV